MKHAAKTRHRDRHAGGLRVHYREAGTPSSTAVVLLHGAPSSSYSFREVLPVVGEHAYVVAPDIPGFGFSDAPPLEEDEYTYEGLSRVIAALLDDLGVTRYVLFVTDYSTPVGYFIATRHPERVLGLVVQNGNAHDAGLGEGWDSARRFLADPTEKNRAALPEWLTFEGTRDTYLAGLPAEVAELHPPESWRLDWERLSRPGKTEVYFQFFYDYRNHVARFGEIADYHAKASTAVHGAMGPPRPSLRHRRGPRVPPSARHLPGAHLRTSFWRPTPSRSPTCSSPSLATSSTGRGPLYDPRPIRRWFHGGRRSKRDRPVMRRQLP